jgi:hydroxypyruvate reductase
MNPRRTLLEIHEAALRAVDGAACVERHLRRVSSADGIQVYAIGKAAVSMAKGARAALGGHIAQMLVITKGGHGDPELARAAGVTLLESAHPVPDESSLAAGAELVRRLAQPAAAEIFLISGGASSLVEVLRAGASLADLQRLNRDGLAAGWDIAELNRRRAGPSLLKSGGVARLLAGRAAIALFLSDVPGDDVDIIGSGLLGRDAGRADRIERVVVGNVDDAVRAAVDAAAARGLRLEAGARRFAGDVSTVAAEFLATLRATTADGLVWGGESTVALPPQPGRGGRNTHLALALARALRAGEPCAILAAGTDGTDGPTEDAGAIVDAQTVERAELAGVDVELAWQRCDSGAVLEASGDLVYTGPTGTNVGDILIGIRQNARRIRDPGAPRVL